MKIGDQVKFKSTSKHKNFSNQNLVITNIIESKTTFTFPPPKLIEINGVEVVNAYELEVLKSDNS